MLTATEAITVAYLRGQVVKQHAQPGGMASLGLGKQDVLRYLRKGINIACENSPKNVTLSGDPEILSHLVEQLKMEQPEIFVRPLNVKVAYHSCTLPIFLRMNDLLTRVSSYVKIRGRLPIYAEKVHHC